MNVLELMEQMNTENSQPIKSQTESVVKSPTHQLISSKQVTRNVKPEL